MLEAGVVRSENNNTLTTYAMSTSRPAHTAKKEGQGLTGALHKAWAGRWTYHVGGTPRSCFCLMRDQGRGWMYQIQAWGAAGYRPPAQGDAIAHMATCA